MRTGKREGVVLKETVLAEEEEGGREGSRGKKEEGKDEKWSKN